MRKIAVLNVVLFCGVFISNNAHAQGRKIEFFDKIKLEAGWGLSTPVIPAKNTSISDFVGLESFYVGTNYLLNETWGVRGTYAYNHFENKQNADIQLTLHKFIAELTMSIGNLISYNSFYSDYNDFDVIVHSGIGVSLGRKKITQVLIG